ncbi:benzoate/H(+) symporter BenE family transporter [Curvibacter sp. APW13]|uniref:benzoate/H(+) symporter BenE family transporter n=1 Tax=Curvibacter sp. APW13 TaxID=3077236 RepID=UPI0028DF51D8|nr:benzoate/H(+) symporter BenE family transporter [Curvibacter sp. APW13]MDT8990013.1 benzoate/H(+) symporter BenE family transporter [Curvibacter sp. APW13]
MRFFRDVSLSAATAGFVAVLVGFTSSVAIVFQAAQAFGATPAIIASWMWALGLGMGLCTLVPSLVWRKPVMVAWSTPGAAVLATAGAAGGFGMGEAVGAFLVCGALITLSGWTGWFERIMGRIPMSLAAALLAGVLARFGLGAFTAAQTQLSLVVVMVISYLAGRRLAPRYAVPFTLLVAILFVALTTGFAPADIQFGLTIPVWVAPQFSFSAIVSLALPLFIVTMASQNMPGVAAIVAAGYGDRRAQGGDAGIPVSPVITLTGVATLVLAPFGAFALNLSAITAAICMGPQAHAQAERRYTAAVACGALYVLIGLFGAAVTGVLMAFPKELVAAIAGLALLGTIAGALSTSLANEAEREAAIITFLVTLSGVAIAGIGSAFWGVVAGVIALVVQHYGRSTEAH